MTGFFDSSFLGELNCCLSIDNDRCSCDECEEMQAPWEQGCCHEHSCMQEKMQEYHVGCITSHPGFQTVVLDPFVLETAYYSYRKKHRRGKLTAGVLSNFRMYRYTAYRQLVRWCWGILGRNNRVALPACAITTIRRTFHSGYSL